MIKIELVFSSWRYKIVWAPQFIIICSLVYKYKQKTLVVCFWMQKDGTINEINESRLAFNVSELYDISVIVLCNSDV